MLITKTLNFELVISSTRHSQFSDCYLFTVTLFWYLEIQNLQLMFYHKRCTIFDFEFYLRGSVNVGYVLDVVIWRPFKVYLNMSK